MDTALVYAALGFGALSSAIALFLFISRSRMQDNLAALQNKLTLEQSRIAELTTKSQTSKNKPEPKTSTEPNKHTVELIELRTRTAHLKDEIKNLKQQLRQSELEIRASDEKTEAQVFKVRSENSALLERLKELEQNSPDKKRAQSLEIELTDQRARNKELQQELNSLQSKLKGERNFAERLKLQCETLETELKQLKTKYPDANTAQLAAQPSIDSKTLERWKDRALTARHMYRMMRQMRELSDLKLSTYQEAVIEVSSTLLNLKGISSPELSPNENKADRLLAEAWALVHQNQQSTDTGANV